MAAKKKTPKKAKAPSSKKKAPAKAAAAKSAKSAKSAKKKPSAKSAQKSPKSAKPAKSAKKPAPKKVTPAASTTGRGSREDDGNFGRYLPWAAVAAVVGGALLWQFFPSQSVSAIPEDLVLRVVETYPHDPEAFTQGLLHHEGELFESTGLRGQSSLRRVGIESGEVAQRIALDDAHFAEGLARVDDRLIQLTWRAGLALVYDLSTFEKVEEFEYRGEGWGLCYDGERLVMSSGSDRLQFRDPETFEKLGEVRVTRAGRRLRQLNELECVDGSVYANVWMDDHIARIDPESGQVTAWIDAGGLLPRDARHGGEDVLNGIAYVPDTGHFLLTGKNWSRMFEVEFVPRD